jgi:CheY-like chemotaxis protein
MPTILLASGSAADTSVRALLESHVEWEVQEAPTAAATLELLDRGAFDIMVTDAAFPDASLEEFLAGVRTRHPLIPIVLMSAEGPDEAVVRALRLGAASYVPRSTLARDLVSTVSRVLALRQRGELDEKLRSRREAVAIAFELENEIELVSPLVIYLQSLLEEFAICGGNERTLAGIAFEEALLNAMIHGNLEIGGEAREAGFQQFEAQVAARRAVSPYRERRVRVEARLTREEATVTVEDEGQGFDPAKVPDPRAPENLAKSGGRGLLLMRTFLDEVAFDERGTRVRLTKRRRPPGEASIPTPP